MISGVQGIKDLIKNTTSDKLRLINICATWCGPCIDDVYEFIEAVDPDWKGALPYTMLIEPGGKIVLKKQDTIDPLQMKKLIVGNKYIGRYY